MTAAFALASIAAAPRVGPTVRCSMTSTGTGSAPPRIRAASSLASSVVNVAGDLRAAPRDADVAGTSSSTCGEEITWSSSRIATRRFGSPGGSHAAVPGQVRPRPPAVAAEVDRDVPAAAALAVDRGLRPVDALSGQRGWTEADRQAVLVVDDPTTSGSGSALGDGDGDADGRRAWASASGTPSTGWNVSWAVRPMTSAASRGSCSPGSSTMMRRSPERASSAPRRRARRPAGAAPRAHGRSTPGRPSRSASPGSPGRSGCRRAGRDPAGRGW